MKIKVQDCVWTVIKPCDVRISCSNPACSLPFWRSLIPLVALQFLSDLLSSSTAVLPCARRVLKFQYSLLRLSRKMAPYDCLPTFARRASVLLHVLLNRSCFLLGISCSHQEHSVIHLQSTSMLCQVILCLLRHRPPRQRLLPGSTASWDSLTSRHLPYPKSATWQSFYHRTRDWFDLTLDCVTHSLAYRPQISLKRRWHWVSPERGRVHSCRAAELAGRERSCRRIYLRPLLLWSLLLTFYNA